MTNVTIQMTLPISQYSWYSGSGSIKIDFYADEISMHTKKDMIKIPLPKTKSMYGANDNPRGFIKDLGKCQETIAIKGWIEDDSTYSAWNKVWMLRGMCTTGGPVVNLTIGDKEFTSATKDAFLESVIWTLSPVGGTPVQTADTTKQSGRAYVQLTFVISEEK